MCPLVERTGLHRFASVTGEVSPRICGGGEAELGHVMFAYSVLFLFSAGTLSFLNCCDLMHFLLVLEFMHVCVFV